MDDAEIQDWAFDWCRYKIILNSIFFDNCRVFSRDSKEYTEFWKFLEKYCRFRSHRTEASKVNPDWKDIIETWSDKFRTKEIKAALHEGFNGGHRKLSALRVQQFTVILHHYLTFLDKEHTSKNDKIRQVRESLPIFQYRSEIIEAINSNQVILVAGDTGCGKSTQVPQYLMESGYNKIACTQPRRIACVSLSKRVAFETFNQHGTSIGFQVRFERNKSKATKILFITEGLVLRQLGDDSTLSQYDVIIIDEVHERHVNTDFILGCLRCLICHRNDLKVVLMSATIDIQLYSSFFNNCAIIQVPGRLYPIKLHYLPPPAVVPMGDRKTSKADPSAYIRIMNHIDSKYDVSERGDLLIFLSGINEIMAVAEAAKVYAAESSNWLILMLHSTLGADEQSKAFDYAPEGMRKCVLATNIAETSVTIDGIRFVVDSGKVKQLTFDSSTKMQKLKECSISKASADQRKGRAGRTGPGVAYRLYSENEFKSFEDYSTPEISRITLDSLVLQMAALGLKDPLKFPFIQPPPRERLTAASKYLVEQGALFPDGSLTPMGKMLSRLPVDVVIGKLLIMGSLLHITESVVTMAAALSLQNIFVTKTNFDAEVMKQKKVLECARGDPFTLLKVYNSWIKAKLQGENSKKWCRRYGIEEQRLYELVKLKRQFEDLLQTNGFMEREESLDEMSQYDRLRRLGDRKVLDQLKRKRRTESHKRKFLKPQLYGGYGIVREEEDEEGDDYDDIEFRLSHDIQRMHDKAGGQDRIGEADMDILSIVLCVSLYPQFAYADDFNRIKNDQYFHTREKPFVQVHPSSVYSSTPEMLKVEESSAQLLTYVSLLETSKPYLINVMPIPALQALLLFSARVDTDSQCRRIMCDEWLELRFHRGEEGQDAVHRAITLRKLWLDMLELKLQAVESEDIALKNRKRVGKMRRELTGGLTAFINERYCYQLRRVMAAELAYSYVGSESTESAEDYKVDQVRGGLVINSFLTHGCLREAHIMDVEGEFGDHMQRHWHCSNCGKDMIVTLLERLDHEHQCKPLEDDHHEEEIPSRRDGITYYCQHCDKTLILSATQVLSHKMSHSVTN